MSGSFIYNFSPGMACASRSMWRSFSFAPSSPTYHPFPHSPSVGRHYAVPHSSQSRSLIMFTSMTASFPLFLLHWSNSGILWHLQQRMRPPSRNHPRLHLLPSSVRSKSLGRFGIAVHLRTQDAKKSFFPLSLVV